MHLSGLPRLEGQAVFLDSSAQRQKVWATGRMPNCVAMRCRCPEIEAAGSCIGRQRLLQRDWRARSTSRLDSDEGGRSLRGPAQRPPVVGPQLAMRLFGYVGVWSARCLGARAGLAGDLCRLHKFMATAVRRPASSACNWACFSSERSCADQLPAKAVVRAYLAIEQIARQRL